jgi:hypothetical protein
MKARNPAGLRHDEQTIDDSQLVAAIVKNGSACRGAGYGCVVDAADGRHDLRCWDDHLSSSTTVRSRARQPSVSPS